MRFYCTNMGSPRAWKETALTSETMVINKYFNEHMRVYDADTCGDDTVYFAFSTGKYYRVVHSWWITDEPEWTMHNNLDVEEISASEAEGIPSDSDWMIISKWTYRPAAAVAAWDALVAEMDKAFT